LFPIWHQPTGALARQMIDAGVRAIVTCVDRSKLTNAFVGRPFDHAFLDSLPENVDPCGENGEFHTFVTHAPSFGSMVRVRSGNAFERDGYCFAPLSLRP
jgi:diphthamide synthase (EF-2-diphthine--ammonia ligase)